MSLRFAVRVLAAALVGACLALAAATPASALSLTNLSVSLGSANSADQLVQGPPLNEVMLSTVSVLSSSATSFATRYAMVTGADSETNQSITETQTATYTITFQVNANPGQAWSVLLDLSRVGSLTLVSDSNGRASASLGAMSGSVSGGTLTGSLGLAAVGPQTGPGGADQPFSQTSTATISGVGTGTAQTVMLNLTWIASATSTTGKGSNGAGDEAAVRMGLDSALTGYTADNYPGPGNRVLANDGQFVSATLVPEPGSMLMMFAGLVGLALFGRRPIR